MVRRIHTQTGETKKRILDKDSIMVFMRAGTRLAQTRPCKRFMMLNKERRGEKGIDREGAWDESKILLSNDSRTQSRLRGENDEGTRDAVSARTQISHLTKESLKKHRSPRTRQLIKYKQQELDPASRVLWRAIRSFHENQTN